MSKSIEKLDERMKDVDSDSFRYYVLETAKNFKTSWIDLGRALYSVWKDKKYREWGYQTFDAYVAKEIGIRKQTSLKLLRSYSFLEQEEPTYLTEEYLRADEAGSLPNYEAIDTLRKAKNKKLDADDYAGLKEKVFLKGKDASEIRRDLTTIMRQREELDPQEAYQRKKEANIKRLVGTLKSLKREIAESKILPSQILKEVNSLINKLSEYLR